MSLTCQSIRLTTWSTLTGLPRVWCRTYPRNTPTWGYKLLSAGKDDYQIWLEAIPRCKIESKVVSPCRLTKADIRQHLIRRGLEGPVKAEHKRSSSSCDESQVTQTGTVALEVCSYFVKILFKNLLLTSIGNAWDKRWEVRIWSGRSCHRRDTWRVCEHTFELSPYHVTPMQPLSSSRSVFM